MLHFFHFPEQEAAWQLVDTHNFTSKCASTCLLFLGKSAIDFHNVARTHTTYTETLWPCWVYCCHILLYRSLFSFVSLFSPLWCWNRGWPWSVNWCVEDIQRRCIWRLNRHLCDWLCVLCLIALYLEARHPDQKRRNKQCSPTVCSPLASLLHLLMVVWLTFQ